jgi:hypothetical protein
MFTWFAVICALGVLTYVLVKRTEGFFVKLACSLFFGLVAYVLALGLGSVAGNHFPSKWVVKHVDLGVLYRDGDKDVVLESVMSNGNLCLHFKRNDQGEFVSWNGNATVQEEGELTLLRIHQKEFVDWGYWMSWLALAPADKYDFIVPKSKRKDIP